MINSLAAMTLERALAQVLQLDPASAVQARALAGRMLELQLLPGPLYLTLVFTETGIDVDGCANARADTFLTLDPVALAAILEGGTPTTQIPGLEMRGDTALAAEVLALFKQLRPDLLGPLRRLLGPAATHVVERTARRGEQAARRASSDLQRAGRDWLTSPHGPLPTATEVNAQLVAIDALRLATDRLEARIQRLQQLTDRRS